MTTEAQRIFNAALTLPDEERARLVEELLLSLHRPDPALDALWAQEAEDRLRAYEAGEMDPIPAEQVFRELRNR